MTLELTLGLTRPPSGASNPHPFTNDSDTYWWDFTSADNTTDTVGDDTLSYVVEQIGGVVDLEQTTKNYQPLVVTDGVDFEASSSRQLDSASVAGMNDAATGIYLAVNAKWDSANGGVIVINGTPDVQVYLTGSRLYGLKLNGAWKMYSTARTLSQWYTLEIKIDTVADDITLWIDGVETTPQFENATGLATFGEITAIQEVGKTSSSLDGTLQHIILQNSLISDAARQSISDYLVSVRP